MLITLNGTTCQVEKTKSGGRIVTAVTAERTIKKYTHPCRAKSLNRFMSDVESVIAAAQGQLPRTKVNISG